MKNLVNFLKSRTGLLVLALVAAIVVYYFVTQTESSTVETSSVPASLEAPKEVEPSTPVAATVSPGASDETSNTEGSSKFPSLGVEKAVPTPANGSTDNPVPGSTDSPSDPVDGEEIHPVSPEDNEAKPDPASGIQKTSIQFDDPTSYYEPTISSFDRAVWANANRAAPRCDNFRFQTRNALLVQAVN